jgi:hypothetical protein
MQTKGVNLTMYRSIGINLDKEIYSTLKHKKYPYLNHSTSLCQNNAQSNNYNKNMKSQGDFQNDMNLEFSINGHQYKIENKNLMFMGIGAMTALSIYKVYKYFTEV